MSTPYLPTVGAALLIPMLGPLADWLIADQRDLELQDPAVNADLLDGDWRPLVREARTILDGYTGRLGIHAPFDGLTILSRDTRVRALMIDRLRQALEFGAALGATHMVVHSPFLFFGTPFIPHAVSTGQASQIAQVHAVLDTILPLAQQANCTLVLETIYDCHPGPLLALVQSFASEYVRLSLDTGHTFLTHQRGGPPPDQWVREGGPLLAHVHLHDNDGNNDRHWPPGKGAINWYALFDALSEREHPPRLILELKKCSQIRPAAAWLATQGFAR